MNKEAFLLGYLEKQANMLNWLGQLGGNTVSTALKTVLKKPIATGGISPVPMYEKLTQMFANNKPV